jgi:hypothetical protein
MTLTLLPPVPLPLPPLVSLAEAVAPLTVTVAVLVNVAGGLLLTVALMVKVTLLLLGMEEIVQPVPCISDTLQIGQIAPPVAEQEILLAVRPVTAGSLNTALINVSPVVLVMTTV